MSLENLFMPYVNNKGADQPAHSRNLISDFVVRCLDSITHLVVIFERTADGRRCMNACGFGKK